MSINEEMVMNVAGLIHGKVIDESLKVALKSAYPDIRFTLCSEDDIHTGKPVFEADEFGIYLVGSSDHCLTLTNDFSLATGVVIAEKFGD